MKIGFDLDGVLCDVSYSDLQMFHNFKEENERIYYKERKPLLNPSLVSTYGDVLVCITSRPFRLKDVTTQWMSKFIPNMNIYFLEIDCSYIDSKKVAIEKLKRLCKLGVEVYFEDDPQIVWHIRSLQDRIKIIQYGGKLK